MVGEGAVKGPDFFIVGAPKCGTTAMTDYLAQHPEIGMCPRKETHFFAGDLYERLAVKRGQRPPDQAHFLALFDHLQDRRTRGEASVWHLYSSVAPHEIKAFEPSAKVIVMLRNPAEMVPSLHSEFVYVGLEPVEDLEAALALDDDRERNGAPPGFPPSSYRSAIRYDEQLRRYLEVFGMERIHVILYDDFRDDTLGTYREVCKFLEVDPGFEPEIQVVNPNKRVRSRLLRRFVRRPPEVARPLLHLLTTEEQRRRIGAALNGLNTRFTSRGAVPGQVREELRPEVERQVVALGELGIDVAAWLD